MSDNNQAEGEVVGDGLQGAHDAAGRALGVTALGPRLGVAAYRTGLRRTGLPTVGQLGGAVNT
jgi:hypothetical protein